ncbi:hypothetical protein GCM10009613_33540 [Pseudonocardia kongjuensis]|uniref:HTH gntR-type domain-containing protein n=1 Tax=Pseudonocardia kongjuensis TaxID=102227 RepID=A0ABP4IHY5_9PSEU
MHPREIERRRAEHSRLRRAAGRAQQDTSPRRAYTQLRVSMDRWPHDDPQLVESELVREFGFSRNSIRKALQMLAGDGLVVRAPRFGTVVARRVHDVRIADPRPAPPRDGTTLRVLQRARVELDGPDGAQPFDMTVELGADDEPLFLRTAFAPAVPPPGAEHVAAGPTAIPAVPAPPAVARALRVPPGAPLLLRALALRTPDGRVTEMSYTHFRGDRVALSA